MRVIGGTWRGRRLSAPRGQAVRPTTDRVKEAVFNMVGAQLRGATVLDLCCGAGGLGIEALSRGAAQAVFVDTSGVSLGAARANLEVCGADPATWKTVRGDALRRLGGLVPDGPWLVLSDPPYASGLAEKLAAALGGLADENFRLAVLEHGADETPRGDGLAADLRSYGTSQVTILRPESEARP